jgi:hypothetical protein
MVIAKTRTIYTVEEYYELEEQAVSKREFDDGEIRSVEGVSPEHSLITVNLIAEFGIRLKGKTCTPYDSNLRVKIPATGLVTYPDALVFCKKLEFDPKDKRQQSAINPTIVFACFPNPPKAMIMARRPRTTASSNPSKPTCSFPRPARTLRSIPRVIRICENAGSING